MRVNPKSEEELQSMTLVAPGIYYFEVVAAKDAISKSGNEMIALTLKVWDEAGIERLVYDYLLDSMPYKINHFAVAVGISDKYQSGNINAEDCIGVCADVELVIQKGQQKPDGGFYNDKNSVKDYFIRKSSGTVASPNAPKIEDEFNDEIPF